MASRIRLEVALDQHLVPPITARVLHVAEKSAKNADYWRQRAVEAEARLLRYEWEHR